MTNREVKCVLIVDESLSAGIIANTAAILGITIGRLVPECIGPDVTDASGHVHTGIVTLPVPILKGTREMLKTLRENLYAPTTANCWWWTFPMWRKVATPIATIYARQKQHRKPTSPIWESPYMDARKKSTN